MAEIDDLKRLAALSDQAGDYQSSLAALRKIDALQKANIVQAPTPEQNLTQTGLPDSINTPLMSAMVGAGKSTARLGQGIEQGYNWLTGDDKANDQLKQQVQNENETYSQIQKNHPYATGAGEVLPAMAMPVAGGASLLGTAGRMALAGALQGGTEYGSPSERLKNATIGAASGVVAPLATSGLKLGAALLMSPFEAGQNKIVGNVLNEQAGKNAPEIAQKLANPDAFVAGSNPTAAEVAGNEGVSKLQRMVRENVPAPFGERVGQNMQARLQALQGIAGTDAERQALKDQIDATSAANYDPLKSQPIPTSQIQPILDRLPRGTLETAADLARMKGEPFSVGGDLTGNSFHYIKLALDNALNAGAQNGLGNVEKGAITDVKNSLVNTYPEYQTAMQAHAENMKPYGAMQIGQALIDKLKPAISDLGAENRELPNAYAKALRDSDTTAQQATGFGGATLENTLRPDQLETVKNVGLDLGRAQNANISAGGSPTYGNMVMDSLTKAAGLPTNVLNNIPVVSGVVKKAADIAFSPQEAAIKQKLAEALLNPSQDKTGAAALMMKYQPSQAQKDYQAALVKALGGLTAQPAGQYLQDRSTK